MLRLKRGRKGAGASTENAINENTLQAKRFARLIAGSFPRAGFTEDGKLASKPVLENLYGSLNSTGLTKRQGQGYLPLINFAREYFNKVKMDRLNKETLAKEIREQRDVTRIEDKTKVSKEGVLIDDKALFTVKMSGSEDLPLQVVVEFKEGQVSSEDSARELAEDAGIKLYFDSDSLEFVSNDGNVFVFNAAPYLSYTDISSNNLPSGLLNIRIEAIKAAIGMAPDNEIGFDVNKRISTKNLQTMLDDAYGKGTYFVKEIEAYEGSEYKHVLILSEDMTDVDEYLAEDLADMGAFYQRGNDGSDIKNPGRRGVSDKTVEELKHVFDTESDFKLNKSEAKVILNSIRSIVGPKGWGIVKNYLKKAKYLKFTKLPSSTTESGKVTLSLGKIFLKEGSIRSNSTAPLHELIHDVVHNIWVDGSEKQIEKLQNLFNKIISRGMEDVYAELETEQNNGVDSGTTGSGSNQYNGLSGRVGSATEASSGNSGNNDGVSRYSGSASGNQNLAGEPTNGSNDGVGQILPRTSGVQNGDMEPYSMAQGIQHEHVNGTGRKIRARKTIVNKDKADRPLVRLWGHSRELINNIKENSLSVEHVSKELREEIIDTLRNDEITMTQKIQEVSIWLDAARAIDEKFGTTEDGVFSKLMADNVIFQEVLAYGSHTVMQPDEISQLISAGTRIMDADARLGSATRQDNQMVITHHMSLGAVRHMIKTFRNGGGIDNLSLGVSTLKNAIEGRLSSYGDLFFILKPSAIDDIENQQMAGDGHTITNGKLVYQIPKGKDAYEMKTATDGRAMVLGGNDASPANLALASFLDYSYNLNELKQQLESRVKDDLYNFDDIKKQIAYMLKKYALGKGLSRVKDLTVDEILAYWRAKDTSAYIKNLPSGIYAALRHYSKTMGDRNYKEAFLQGSGRKIMPDGLSEDIDKLVNMLSSYTHEYGEIKLLGPMTKDYIHAIYDMDNIIPEEDAKALTELGVNVIKVSKENIQDVIIRDAKQSNENILFQSGREDNGGSELKSDPVSVVAKIALKRGRKGAGASTEKAGVFNIKHHFALTSCWN